MGGLLAESGAGDNAAPLSVSEISGSLKRVVEDRFGFVRIRGEISGYKRAASGHVYLALKDDKAVLDGVMWKGNAGRLPFQPEDGIEVVVSGKLTTYPGRFTMWHVKDMDKNKPELNTEVGSGSIDFKSIFAAADTAGLKHLYVEQENFSKEPYQSITESITHIKEELI